MINVIASIRVKPESLAEFLRIFKSNVPRVREERGCIEYFPALDVDVNLPAQHLDGNVVTVIEKWESVEDLKAHLGSPHMAAYRESVKDLVASVSLKVLQEA